MFFKRAFLVSVILVAIFVVSPHSKKVYANHCLYTGINGQSEKCSISPQHPPYRHITASCNSCLGYDASRQAYAYRSYTQTLWLFNPNTCADPQTTLGPIEYYTLPQNSNVLGCWIGGQVPQGCNQGFSCGQSINQ